MKIREVKKLKTGICTSIGVTGSVLATLFGGWDAALQTLIIFMIVDFMAGMIVAGVFKNSTKTDGGALESRAGWEGLIRKGMTLLFVLIAARLDLIIGTNYIRDAVCIGFIANELISIVENAGLMGVPLPDVILKSIDILNGKNNDYGKLPESETEWEEVDKKGEEK